MLATPAAGRGNRRMARRRSYARMARARILREIREDDAGAGAHDGGVRLPHGARLVDHARRGRRLDHGILAADGVGGERHVEALARPPDDVEVRQRRLHHHDVGALLDVEGDLAQRLIGVRRVHLVAAAVAEPGRRVGGLAERPVEGRRVLRRVRHDRDVREARMVETGADGPDPAVHHVRGRDEVGAGARVRDGHRRERLEAGVVDHLAPLDQAAVAVVGVLAEAHVGHDQQIGEHPLDRRHGAHHDTVRRVRRRADRILPLRNAEQHHRGNPEIVDRLALLDETIDRQLGHAGHGGDRLGAPAPRRDEERQHEPVDAGTRLRDQTSQDGCSSQAARAMRRIAHRSVTIVNRLEVCKNARLRMAAPRGDHLGARRVVT